MDRWRLTEMPPSKHSRNHNEQSETKQYMNGFTNCHDEATESDKMSHLKVNSVCSLISLSHEFMAWMTAATPLISSNLVPKAFSLCEAKSNFCSTERVGIKWLRYQNSFNHFSFFLLSSMLKKLCST